MKNIKSGSNLTIIETTKIRQSDKFTLEKIIGKKLRMIAFPRNLSVNQSSDKLSVSTQQIILCFEEFEVLIANHYHESVFNTGLKSFVIVKKNKANRPYNSSLKLLGFDSRVETIEVWGIKEESIPWDKAKIDLYKTKNQIPVDISSVNHFLSMNFILRFSLSSNFSIILKADAPNHIIGEYIMHHENKAKNQLEKYFFLWETYR